MAVLRLSIDKAMRSWRVFDFPVFPGDAESKPRVMVSYSKRVKLLERLKGFTPELRRARRLKTESVDYVRQGLDPFRADLAEEIIRAGFEWKMTSPAKRASALVMSLAGVTDPCEHPASIAISGVVSAAGLAWVRHYTRRLEGDKRADQIDENRVGEVAAQRELDRQADWLKARLALAK